MLLRTSFWLEILCIIISLLLSPGRARAARSVVNDKENIDQRAGLARVLAGFGGFGGEQSERKLNSLAQFDALKLNGNTAICIDCHSNVEAAAHYPH